MLEILPLRDSEPIQVKDIISYVQLYEDYLTADKIRYWLKYYSIKPNSVLEKSTDCNAYFLDTATPRNKLFVEDIIPLIRKKYEAISDFSQRDQSIINFYQQGLTLQEIGEKFELTRERIRQIILPAIDGNIIKKNKRRISEKALHSMKERGVVRGRKTQKYPKRNAKIIELSKTELSYSQIGKILGFSRSSVCSVIYRFRNRNS